ncbi:MAG TPA: 4-hydroxythreonine-4-phosphate dehydrogenase PdxA [Candidatus Binatia bacterium]
MTLGDPVGVGPEVALRAVRDLVVEARRRGERAPAHVVLIGDAEATRETIERLGLAIELEPTSPDELARHLAAQPGAKDAGARSGRARSARTRGALRLPLVAPDAALARPLRARERRPGKPSVAAAHVAYGSIRRAVELAQAGLVDGICTAPISKEWLDRAGVASTGHTEILAELTRSDVRLMMAYRDELRVVLATTHLALRDVPRALTVDGIRDTILITARHLERWFGIARPRVAVCALNPHASDGGVYGDEEARIIAPAIARARAARVDAFGPVPADTLFSAIGPRHDAVVAMYHDQGLIPVKQLDVHHTVNVTLGLPFIRTSPDHGTAYDLAGRGTADPRSMRAALDMALTLARIERRARASSGRSHRRSAPAA